MPAKVALALAAEAAVFALLLFGSAGTLRWPEAWIFLIIFFGCATSLTITLARDDPALLNERMRTLFQRGQPLWDKVLLGIIGPLFIAWLAVMGADSRRFHWSNVPAWLEVAGAFGVALSMWAVGRVFRANTFLAPVVKIQEERTHTVISTGPYAIVRHPMYASVLWLFIATPLLLGSWYGVGVSALIMLGIAIRTALEDRELHHRLAGYTEYAQKVRYRLIPFVW